MGSRADLIEALKIAEKYEPGDWISAEHDVIYLCDIEKVSLEDRKALKKYGCHVEDGAWWFFT